MGLGENKLLNSKYFESAIGPLLTSCSYQEIPQLLKNLESVPLDEELVRSYDIYFDAIAAGMTRVATTDPARTPADDEIVVCYGNYPPTIDALCFGRRVRRHVLDFWTSPLVFDRVEGADCWGSINRIIYINLASRLDRKVSILRELARAGARLDLIECQPGIVVRKSRRADLNGAIGCLSSHLEACRRLRSLNVQHGLIFEDDFGFVDDTRQWQEDLSLFFQRDYDYDICLLASSKHGPVEPLDDLVCRTWQPCTNASAYLVSAAGLNRLIPCFEKALTALLATGDMKRYAADRCWAELQGDRFLLFNRKMGYQLSSYSNIESSYACYFD